VIILVAAERVETLDGARRDARLHAEPNRCADDQDVGRHDLGVDTGPIVHIITELGAVLDHAEADAMLEHVDELHRDTLRRHDTSDARQQPTGMRL
jgi:hypothetical protein